MSHGIIIGRGFVCVSWVGRGNLAVRKNDHNKCWLPLHKLGTLTIRRASHVEPTADGQWQADLSPVNDPVLGPFGLRSEAISAEVECLRLHYWI
jgi:hypothetical protein